MARTVGVGVWDGGRGGGNDLERNGKRGEGGKQG